MISLELDEKHTKALEEMALDLDMSKSAVLRQALRMYQMIHFRIKSGERLAFTKDGKVVPMIICGLGEPDARS